MTPAQFAPGAVDQRLTPTLRQSAARHLVDVTIAVIGATGAVGLEALALLVELGLDDRHIIPVASETSVGRTIQAGGREFVIRPHADALTATAALVAAPADASRAIVPRLLDSGVLVSDNSSAFRHAAPLVIPEINPEAITPDTRLVASPNCTTTIALTALAPILREHRPREAEIVSYQAASGAGLHAMNALLEESADLIAHRPIAPRWLSHPAAFSVFPHESTLDPDTGLSEEEAKFERESRRILTLPPPRLAATCLRVPVLRTHTIAARLRLDSTTPIETIRTHLQAAPGVRVVDHGPTSLDATLRAEVLVGRLRLEPHHDDGSAILRAVIAGDQLLKGAAWNAVQNAALLIGRHQ
ncbi:MAG: aspartate-semialdehyde dehydrogenase [Phycisphaerales bacterium]